MKNINIKQIHSNLLKIKTLMTIFVYSHRNKYDKLENTSSFENSFKSFIESEAILFDLILDIKDKVEIDNRKFIYIKYCFVNLIIDYAERIPYMLGDLIDLSQSKDIGATYKEKKRKELFSQYKELNEISDFIYIKLRIPNAHVRQISNKTLNHLIYINGDNIDEQDSFVGINNFFYEENK